ncbi:hypothetical protein N7467_005681 [Penicillium canescens]|nr:hypothetical protein N7467_005681 [Penicillium canescens]
MRYSLRGRNRPTGFYNEDYEPLKPKKSASRITARKTPAKRKAKAAKPAPKKPAPKKEKIPKDLDKSYVGRYTPEVLPRPKKQTWKHDGEKPIADMKKVPPGWSSHDSDLDPDDIDAQIERCRERIKAKIMPSIFEARLKEYLNRKEERDTMMNDEAEDLSWNVVQRLDDLENIRSWLEKGNDDDDQIPNVDAIIQAYTVGDLDWNAGLVTYWSKGKQLCQPRPFKWEEFLAISAKHKGHIGFWVEGSRVDIRLNDTVQSHPFSYVKDSGAHLMTISDRDFAYLHKVSVTIEGFDPKPAASMGVTRVHLHGGEELFWRSKALQIKFRDPDHPKRGDWEWVQCHLSEEKVMDSDRIPDSGNCVLYRDSLLWKYGPREGINRKPQGVV